MKLTDEQLRNSGGPAFPVAYDHQIFNDQCLDETRALMTGMTLRDYMAVHSTQPGASEIAAVAGVVWNHGRIWRPHDDPAGNGIAFDVWWESMPLDQRLGLAARVRYAQSDAMLAARCASKES